MQNSNPWRKTEPGLEALVEWLDLHYRHSPTQAWGFWGGLVGGSAGLACGVMAIVSNMRESRQFVILFPFLAWLLFSLGMTFWVIKRNRSNKVWSTASKGIMFRLSQARWQGNLRQTLGEERAKTLNDGAAIYLQTLSTLQSPHWNVATGLPVWSKMKMKATHAMDSAMGHLVLQIASHGNIETCANTISDMVALRDEVLDASNRLANSCGLNSTSTDTLRETLRELKELRIADEEINSNEPLNH